MTVASDLNRADFTITSGTTEYPFTFRVFDGADFVVVKRSPAGVESLMVLNTDYTVTGAGNYDGGKIVTSMQFSIDNDGYAMTARRVLDIVQETSIRNQGTFYPETHEDVFDRLTMIDQQQQEEIDRSFKLSVTSVGVSAELPVPVAGRALKWNPGATALVNSENDPDEVVSNAAAHAAAAANSANAAANSAAASAASYDAFDDRYLGSKAADPATDNDGNPLLEGALYWNSVDNKMRVYDGAAWQDVVAFMNFVVVEHSGDGVTTNFSLPFSPGSKNNVFAYIGGIYQQKSEYSTPGAAINFTAAPPSGVKNIELVIAQAMPIGSADAANVTFLQSGTNAVQRASQDKMRERVTFEDFGAVGDGVTNDTAAVNAALATGRGVRGVSGKVYAVSGNIILPAGTNIEDAKFKQLTPTGGNRRTLFANGVDRITLRRVTVDRNGDGTYGALNDDAGIWINGGTGHLLEDVEVFGNDMGNGVTIVGASFFKVVRPYIHDIKYVLGSDPADDRVQGLYIQNCSFFTVVSALVKDLGGDFGAGATTQYSRAIAVGGSAAFTISDCTVANVDQGFDITGGGSGNENYMVTGCFAYNCRSWGFKNANTPIEGTYTACTAKNCGYAGFVVSGPVEDGLPTPRAVTFIGCKAINTGSNGVWAANNPSGFLVLQGAFQTDRPRPVRFIGCEAIDNQPTKTMSYGFRNQVSTTASGQEFNECVNCTSFGHITSAFSGFAYPAASVYRTSAQSIPNNATTSVNWDAEDFDGAAMHSTSSNSNAIFAPRAGWYVVTAKVAWTANSTGIRVISLVVNGVLDARSSTTLPALNNDMTISTSKMYYLNAGDNVSVSVYQNSGAALNLTNNNSFFELREAMPHAN